MQRVCVWIVSVSMLLMLLWSAPLDSQHATDHRKVPQRAELQQEFRAEQGEIEGSWGTWGPWSVCSRTCGKGVQEQSRPCLPVYTPSQYPSRRGGVHSQQPGHVISALRPTVPLHRDTGWPSNSSSRGELSKEARPGGRRRFTHIIPGRYGYGRGPYMAPLQTDTGQGSGTARPPRHKRSAAADAYNPTARGRGTHRSNNPKPSNNNHRYSKAYTQPRVQQPQNNHVWAPLYQPGSVKQAEEKQEIQSGSQTSGAQQHQERPYNPLPTSFCTGEHAHYRICNSNACTPSSLHIRAVQCSSYNNQPFMGRLYDWEPFNEVPGDQRCELNCRAIGFRFYVRQSEKVIDGTPCGQNDTFLCVAGKCTSLGCDEYLGSGKVMDKCGVCGGDNTTCRLVSGVFKHSLSKIGYHKIVEIPEGATKINVTEMVKSRNYLALRSRSGRSIINGNWAIDRPGKYEGGGTMFTYRRPNEISSTAGESFLAEGPTNEILDVYMIFQQPNPGVHYEYIVPSEKPFGPQQPNHRPEGNTVNGQGGFDHNSNTHQENFNQAGGGRYPPLLPDNQVPVAPPSRRERDYNWKLTGATECSASCGKGFRYSVFHCVNRMNHDQVSDALCDSSNRPSPQEEACNLQPCPAFWDIGEWSECSKTCGLGMQHRQVLCRQVYANRTLNIHTSRCRHLERPETASTCQLKICSEWQIRSEWTACSVPCGLGQRSREVRCVSNVGDFVPDEECNMNLRPVDVENCDMGACAKSWFYTEWGSRCSAECGIGVQTRGVLCLTNYISSLPLEGCGNERPADSQACNNGPCENRFEWFTGPWSQCSAECGMGSQQRSVVCLMKSDEEFTIMPPYECSSLERPLSQQSCNLKTCGAKWYHTDWSACSKTCEGGFRVREVRCLSDNMLSSEGCDKQLRPAEKETCHPEPCTPHIDENCRDKYFNCKVVVQARLCVYDYYKMTCCASCSQVAHRQWIRQGRS
ncbi:thrombospondin type-1 domain-containing protein 4 [Mastacembelus armatus]|uniref:Thrombospondin type 1 domain containing 4 n=1 Tax=Mastacembelus armatus TaxID=205130 RepID=A0A3Q3L2C7_9TELE|nr:thrombospondin type-1 domain-containing protein 4 [Mastacembelus armatus]XP_026148772.1 thrombospondin type-1 domain-containing protein 4 [Mastacembelus armatus]